MPYSAPDRTTLRAGIQRDLRDPNGATFTANELNDMLNYAMVEVGRIYPKEDVQELTVATDNQRQYATDAVAIFRVEVIQDSRVVAAIPPNREADTAESGWDLHGGILYLPWYVCANLVIANSPTVRVWGYWARDLFSTDGDVMDGDAEVEFAVRTFAVLTGYQRLQNDRILFQQWLTNTGNTDVSPNQLAQVADLYRSQWDSMRNRLRKVQRV